MNGLVTAYVDRSSRWNPRTNRIVRKPRCAAARSPTSRKPKWTQVGFAAGRALVIPWHRSCPEALAHAARSIEGHEGLTPAQLRGGMALRRHVCRCIGCQGSLTCSQKRRCETSVAILLGRTGFLFFFQSSRQAAVRRRCGLNVVIPVHHDKGFGRFPVPLFPPSRLPRNKCGIILKSSLIVSLESCAPGRYNAEKPTRGVDRGEPRQA